MPSSSQLLGSPLFALPAPSSRHHPRPPSQLQALPSSLSHLPTPGINPILPAGSQLWALPLSSSSSRLQAFPRPRARLAAPRIVPILPPAPGIVPSSWDRPHPPSQLLGSSPSPVPAPDSRRQSRPPSRLPASPPSSSQLPAPGIAPILPPGSRERPHRPSRLRAAPVPLTPGAELHGLAPAGHQVLAVALFDRRLHGHAVLGAGAQEPVAPHRHGQRHRLGHQLGGDILCRGLRVRRDSTPSPPHPRPAPLPRAGAMLPGTAHPKISTETPPQNTVVARLGLSPLPALSPQCCPVPVPKHVPAAMGTRGAQGGGVVSGTPRSRWHLAVSIGHGAAPQCRAVSVATADAEVGR